MSKVLIVEDDTFLANAYRVKLVKEGFEVELAMNGTEAMEKLASFKPEVMLLDLVMSEKDGFSVLEELRAADAEYKGLRVIVASNLGQQSDIDRALELGADDYIVKSNESLSEIVDKLRGGDGESAADTTPKE